jgi:hypothetical protein
MKNILAIACLFFITVAYSQPRLELGPAGFPAVKVTIPATTNEKLLELSRNWATEANRRGSFDVSNVTENSMTITAVKENAFFYRNRGEAFEHDVKYDMKLAFNQSSYTVAFIVKEIYHDGVRIESTLPDYFTSDGKLKEDYGDVETSLEATVNNLVKSHYNFIMNFR